MFLWPQIGARCSWAAVINLVDANALLLFLVIFTWTPRHLWAHARARRADYSKAGVPMLPVTHGVEFTCRCIVLYTILLAAVTVLPYLTRMSGVVYLGGGIVLNVLFVRRAIALQEKPSADAAMRTFRYSINYLMLSFTIRLIDHYWQPI